MSRDVIIRPILSEKMSALEESQHKYAFVVRKDVNKMQIKAAIEKRFEVAVEKVATMNIDGKIKRSTVRSGGRVIRTEGRRTGIKKAIVTLKNGQTIDLFRGEQAV
ncbi:MAG TPA: 50S ribosomal protein L23 [Candidatus Marinimicrobia bacterium]|nr:MAG: 50S ribosomal protein L23 [Candidatus Marinimicrobia bacterium CG1_02_48_14]PIZ62858.1 MAG: 50S ribosomal protein L23 [Candidatus Marinimicrobia bacterium CG_4_10_14_0_2_um_filter_48_9]PJA54088.1 MAG: 50S ribosomal protein L23 [Candidatus Marinimicrobia bacterium CG_4_9_14_3_um_filter_48_9]HCW75793.1 50S ribosomal protein L23 [Candidatus Neomarinimicrobiota bacterium]